MTGINIEGAIFAASGRDGIKQRAAAAGMLSVKEWLDDLGVFDRDMTTDKLLRLAHMIGQCAHESMGFEHSIELLSYRSAELIKNTFGRGKAGRRRFPSLADCHEYVRQPRLLANYVYANRNGNGDVASGDGWRFRGMGYLQLTGRGNYLRRGLALDIDLESNPNLATKPDISWKIAASYLDTRTRSGKTAFEWADEGNDQAVTRIINGGLHGLDDRTRRTALALAALTGG